MYPYGSGFINILNYTGIASIKTYSFPLDNLSNNAYRAYSFRRLRSNYTGPLVKLRRSSDNAVADIQTDSTNVINGNSIVSTGGNLTSWATTSNLYINTVYDQSSLGINAVQSTLAAQPQFILSGGINNNYRPIFRLAGAQYLSIGSPITGPSNLTFAFVQGNITTRSVVNRIFQSVRTSDNYFLFGIANSAAQNMRTTFYGNSASSILDVSAGSVLSANFTQYLLSGSYSSLVTLSAYQKGVLIANQTSSTAWINTQTPVGYEMFGASRSSSFYIGDFCEFVMFTNVLSSADQNKINTSQIKFYNL